MSASCQCMCMPVCIDELIHPDLSELFSLMSKSAILDISSVC